VREDIPLVLAKGVLSFAELAEGAGVGDFGRSGRGVVDTGDFSGFSRFGSGEGTTFLKIVAG
jgi:hypothetical protein